LNLKNAIALAHEAFHRGAEIIAFPEMFLYRGSPASYRDIAKKTENVIHKFQHIACLNKIGILLGSFLERSSRPKHYFNTSLFISPRGELAAKYRKIHLFDVETPKKTVVQESRHLLPGRSLACAEVSGVQFGFTICFDLRFPEQFRELARRGAEVIFVPSNFLYETGKAHWHVLLRARAIENQCLIVAPAQTGRNRHTGERSFGHSLLVGPWGDILAEGSGGKSEVVLAEIDMDFLRDLRKKFPVSVPSSQ
jgi:deaminated glutathione amidase